MPTDPVYESVVTLVQALLDDQPASWAKDDFLLPHINSAQRYVAQHLIDNEVPTLRVRTGVITIPANTVLLSKATTPSLPAGMDIPMAIWEASQGADASQFVPLNGPFQHDPSWQTRGDTLGCWNWIGSTLQFAGCSAGRDIMIDYVANLVDMTVAGPNVAFLLPQAIDAIAALAASFVATSRGQTQLATDMGAPQPDRTVSGRAGFALGTIVSNQKAPEQGPVQRRPYIVNVHRPW